ncbi:DNA-directed RNA polymerase subunit alpha [bacterium]|jgi:DNA-directed RNA polymerase subunit alpha|nr:DNA-directed RNA polymerase subunit alpha [bacterium]MBT5015216.1 DNA-directed RNA polymerase subunit alpha [bacterium]
MNKEEYKPLTIPRITWDRDSLSDTYGKLVAQPLEPGFGITMGNSLRRVLLAAVEGSAVTSVIIKGVNNEFATMPGVTEDVMQLVLNIKEIVIKSLDGKPGKMSLNFKGEGAVKVSDIKADDNLQLINIDHVLGHVAQGGELDIEFFVESGRGYLAAQWPIGAKLQDDNKIFIDAMFSPVKKVQFDVEKTRVGQDIDFDKLTLEVETNGAEKPADIFHYAVSVLRTQLEHYLVDPEIDFNAISEMPEQEEKSEKASSESLGLKGVPIDLLLKPIEDLELSARAHNCLIAHGIKRILDLVNLSEDEGLKIKNFGRKSLNEVKDSMKAFGLNFGMDIKEEDIQNLLKS